MDLIIVESPTKAKTLGRFLGPDYQIEASMGHIVDLPKKKLGVDVAHGFAPEYVIPAEKEDKAAELRGAGKKAKTIILATDPDREGEAIAWHIASLLDGGSGKIQRITFHEITELAVKEALGHPGQINMQLVDAQQARRVLDRLVGYKLSPLLWRKVRRGLSAGRVQSVAVRLIVEREREIQAFKPQEYWEIVAKLKTTQEEFEAKLAKIGDRQSLRFSLETAGLRAAEIKTKEEADKIVGELSRAEYKVASVETKELKRYPYGPFTTSTLQQAASNLMGWSAKKTMQVAQKLYEEGLITYHRTDSTNLAAEALDRARKFILSQYGEGYLPSEPKFYKTKSKVAQEAHEAIRPTDVGQGLTAKETLDRDQTRLYDLVWKRFVACQMTEALYEQTSVDIKASVTLSGVEGSSYLFRAGGSKQLFDGWQKLYERTEDEEGEELPELTMGEILKLLGLVPSQHWTEPPARYTEASLIKTLEEYGIGRPSTYAPIISTIQERQYVEKLDKKFQPTNLGYAVNDFLLANFPNILDYQFTAGMEDQLDQIANGEKQWVPVVSDFYSPFEEQLSKVVETAQRVKVAVEMTSELCPEHGVPLVVRIGRFGKFLACSKFPECKFTKPFMQKIGMKCPKCGTGEVILRKTRSKRTFYGCSRYPDCDFASWTKPKVVVSSEQPVA